MLHLPGQRALVIPGDGVQIAQRRTRGAVAFSPTDITGLILWLDANTISTLWQDSARTTQVAADGDPVGAWDDRSASGYNFTQATSASRPTYRTGGINSLPTLDFDGSDDCLEKSYVAGLNPAALTHFLVVRVQGGAGNYRAPWGSIDGTVSKGWNFYADNGNTWVAQSRPGGSVSADAATVDQDIVLRARISAASNRFKTGSGTEQSGTPTYTQNNDGISYVGANAASFKFNGYISEILLYDSELGTTDLSSLTTYFSDKYGLTI